MGFINSCELGFKSISLKKLQALKIIFLLNTTKFNLKLCNKYTKIIYIGSHGPDYQCLYMNLLLPSFNITETNAHFLNINNFLQKA